jgi:hypothetical protein
MSRPGELMTGLQHLKRATGELQRQWAETRELWDDQTARLFERQHLESMLPALRLVIAATAEIDELYRHAIQECQDPQDDTLGIY